MAQGKRGRSTRTRPRCPSTKYGPNSGFRPSTEITTAGTRLGSMTLLAFYMLLLARRTRRSGPTASAASCSPSRRPSVRAARAAASHSGLPGRRRRPCDNWTPAAYACSRCSGDGRFGDPGLRVSPLVRPSATRPSTSPLAGGLGRITLLVQGQRVARSLDRPDRAVPALGSTGLPDAQCSPLLELEWEAAVRRAEPRERAAVALPQSRGRSAAPWGS